jgi:hypothetical protein
MPANGQPGIPALVRFQDSQLTEGARDVGLVAEALADAEGALVLPGRLVVVPAVLSEPAETVVAAGHGGLVAEALADGEGALVLPGRFVVVPAGLGDPAETVISAGHGGLVAEALADVEGAPVMAGRLVVVPAQLGKDAKLIDPGRVVGRIGRKAGESVVDKRSFLIPGAPDMQLTADRFGDPRCRVFGLPRLQQVVPCFQHVMNVSGLVLRPYLCPPLPVRRGLPVRRR